ncbi:MAG: hypothetical protein QM756_39700 [Polyangiaceae bacterium]
MSFPDGEQKGPYPLQQTADGYRAGTPLPWTSGPASFFSVNCATQVVSLDEYPSAAGCTQFNGQHAECTIFVIGEKFGSFKIGTTIWVEAEGTCRTDPLYQFELQQEDGTATVVQAWSSNPAWNWSTSGYPMGTYVVTIRARSEGMADEVVTASYRLVLPPPGWPGWGG